MIQPIGETVIVAALRRGDLRRAVEFVVEIYHDEMFGYCASLLGLEQAMQVYPPLLLSALEELPTYAGEVSLRAWLYGIARRTVVSHGQAAVVDGGTPVDFAAPPRLAQRAEALAGLRLKDTDLEVGFATLDQATREILQLTLWQGLSLEEVAYVTKRSALQTRRLAAHGLALLSSALQRYATTPS